MLIRSCASFLLLMTAFAITAVAQSPMRVGIVGLVHGHAGGFLSGGALAPAGGASHRPDVQIVGVVEPDDSVYERYANRYHWSQGMRFRSIAELASGAHPQAVLVFTSTADHTQVVKECAAHGIHVMMEKPMAVSYADALQMTRAADEGHIHVLVDYETTWYGSNKAIHDLVTSGQMGPVVKAVFRDGHQGPAKIGVQPEFLNWLTDPKQNGGGALYDFGCYGADLMTWFLAGETPVSVSAVVKHLQPEAYPKVDDEADVVVEYKSSVAILQGSWDWPFGLKETDLYGRNAVAQAANGHSLAVRRHEKEQTPSTETVQAPPAPYDDPLHYLAAVIRGEIQEGDDPSSLKTNLTVAAILDAARESAQTGRKVTLPLSRK